jgi:uncharacterized membrane protein YhaH (DUF805 family)
VIGVAGFFAAIVPFGISLFGGNLGIAPLFLPILPLLLAILSISGSSLVVRRAHDLGWPAALVLAACLAPVGILLAPITLAANAGAGVAWMESATSTPIMIAAFLFSGFLYFWLALKKGQPDANRYGPVPT